MMLWFNNTSVLVLSVIVSSCSGRGTSLARLNGTRSFFNAARRVEALSGVDRSLPSARLSRNTVDERWHVVRRASTIPSAWTLKGCYTDSTSSRTLVSYSSSTNTNTPQTCLSTCNSKGYNYGGVEYGSECYCANSMAVSSSQGTGQLASMSDCSMPCSGDSSQTCGNGNRIMIYTYSPSLPNGWSPNGCYTDAVSNRALTAYSLTASTNTPSSCAATCASKGYSFAGVEYGTECYCANSITVTTSPSSGQVATASDCLMACAGDASLTCGNGGRIFISQYTPSSSTSWTSTASTTSVTSTASSSTPSTTSNWTSSGCFSDSSTRALTGYSTTSSSNTPTFCTSLCASQGWIFAGVEYGQECYCGNSITVSSSAGQVEPASDCSMACAGDPSKLCGGNYRISIYSLVSGTTSTSTAISTTSSTTTSPTSTSISTTSSSAMPSSWVGLGCYTDSSSRALSAYSMTSTINTPSLCTSLCASQGYSLAGVEFGQECYCGNTINVSSKAGQFTSSSDCNVACAGDSSKTCGGSWRVYIYQFTSSTTSIMPSSTTSTLLPISTVTTASITTTSPSASSPTTIPNGSGKVVVAHFMVGNSNSYTQSTWASNIAVALAGGIDGFALNVGIDSWQPARVADAYAVAQGTPFKLFLSFDMSSLTCGSASDATILRSYINNYVGHPNQLYYKSKHVVTTFSGSDCRFGQGDINSAWNYAVKQGVSTNVLFIPSFFSDTSTFSSTTVMDGDFNWNGGWPMGDFDVDFSTDQTHINAIGGRSYIAPVSPAFFTHYGPNSYNKNWIYRSDDWLYNSRWDLLIQNRNSIDIVEIISWNDYGESHYIGPIGTDQPNSQAWVNGFDHQGWTTMTMYYANAWRTGVYPTVTKNQIFLSARPHSRDLNINDPVGKPSNWPWTDDYLYAVVFATGSGSLNLSIGSSFCNNPISAGVNKIKLALSPGSPTAILKDSSGAVILSFSPSGFSYITNPSTYNFNYYMAASP